MSEESKPEFRFRIAFHVRGEDRIDLAENSVVIVADGTRIVKLHSGEGSDKPIQQSSRLIVSGRGYASEEEARDRAQAARDALIAWAARTGLGLDFREGTGHDEMPPATRLALMAHHGVPVQVDNYGVQVWEATSDQLFLQLPRAPGNKVEGPGFAAKIAELLNGPKPLTAAQRIAAELFSLSMFEMPPRSRFVLLMTAFESLLEPSERADEVQAFVDDALKRLSQTSIDVPTKQMLASALGGLRRESIGAAAQRFASILEGRTYDGKPAAEYIRHAYKTRSNLSHTGKAKADLRGDALVLRDFMYDLLWELMNRNSGEGTWDKASFLDRFVAVFDSAALDGPPREVVLQTHARGSGAPRETVVPVSPMPGSEDENTQKS